MKKFIVLFIVLLFLTGCTEEAPGLLPVNEDSTSTTNDTSDQNVVEEEENEDLTTTDVSTEPKAVEADPVKEDLTIYLYESIASVVELEAEAIAAYDSVTGDNYIDDETTYYHIQDVAVPLFTDLIEQIEAFQPTTPEVRELNEIYIEAMNTQNIAMVKILAALETGDYDLLSEANQMLADGRALGREFMNKGQALKQEHGVE